MALSRAFLAVCLIVRNEAEYICEWLNYHQAIGVEKFFIYNNNSTDRTAEIVENWAGGAPVRLMHWPAVPGQLAAYSHAIDTFRNEAEWCAFIDCDEFLCPQSDLSVAQVLSRLDDDCGALYVHWLMFGSSGQVTRSPGQVTERFVLRGRNDFGPNCFGKTIVRMRRATHVLNPHIVQCEGRMLNDAGEEIDQTRHGYHGTSSHQQLALNHYFTKSLEEWRQRRSLGKADKQAGDVGFMRSEEEFRQHDVNDVMDTRAAKITKDGWKPRPRPVPVPGQLSVQTLSDLPETLEYTGEFGPELALFLPFVSWLSQTWLLRRHRIVTYRGMRCFYSNLHCLEYVEKDEPRRFVPLDDRPWYFPNQNEHYVRPHPMVCYPDLRELFGSYPIDLGLETGGKPILIIHNKYNDEWGRGAVNFFSLELLDAIFARYKSKFAIVYMRHAKPPPSHGFSSDHNTAFDLGEAPVLAAHPEVRNFDDLYRPFEGMFELNVFKSLLCSRAFFFLSVQGGGSYQLAMFSGSTLAILHRSGQELDFAYHQGFFRLASNPTPVMLICLDDADVLSAVAVMSRAAVCGERVQFDAGDRSALLRLSPAAQRERAQAS